MPCAADFGPATQGTVLFSAVQNPVLVVAELHGNQLGEGARDGFVFVAVRPAVTGQNIKIVFRNADALGELSL